MQKKLLFKASLLPKGKRNKRKTWCILSEQIAYLFALYKTAPRYWSCLVFLHASMKEQIKTFFLCSTEKKFCALFSFVCFVWIAIENYPWSSEPCYSNCPMAGGGEVGMAAKPSTKLTSCFHCFPWLVERSCKLLISRGNFSLTVMLVLWGFFCFSLPF